MKPRNEEARWLEEGVDVDGLITMLHEQNEKLAAAESRIAELEQALREISQPPRSYERAVQVAHKALAEQP